MDNAADNAPATDSRDLLGRTAVVPPRVATWLTAEPVQIAAFAGTMLLSALLLFSVQPMFARLALPKLGGSPSVWAVSMCFFQGALLAGYCYAHFLTRRLSTATGLLVHLTVLAFTVMVLPIGLPGMLGEPPAGDAYLWLIAVLAAGVGLPFFAVSATAPLLQAWFARTGHAQASDPYFLYGASNLGSLAALIAYPLVIEPQLGLSAQTGAWSSGFGLLMAAIAGCGLLTVVALQGAGSAQREEVSAGPAPAWTDRAIWMGLAGVPSGLMVAVTTYVTTDIASAPFVWVVPLALFLSTFILVFRERPAVPYEEMVLLLPFVVMAQLILPMLGIKMVLAVGAFFLAAIVCHRELYVRRPGARHLTDFYISMSAGGVAGGILAAIVAPQVFTSVFEFTLFLVIAMFCRPGVILGAPADIDWRRVGGFACLAVSAVLVSILAFDVWGNRGSTVALLAIAGGVAAAILLTREKPERAIVFSLALATVIMSYPAPFTPVHVERSFFGTVRVVDTDDGKHRLMLHGTTLHGARRLKDDAGAPVKVAEPATYYQAATPMARAVTAARLAKSAGAGTGAATPIKVGIVGLGTGSLACFAKPGDEWRFYEIDPVIIRIARDPRYFDFMSRCAPDAPVIVGDARLTLAKENAGAFDYLVIDAFSSDSVPVHLLTAESIALYLERIAPMGIVALHVSNRHLDLIPAVASTVASVPGAHGVLARFDPKDANTDAAPSNVILIARNQQALDTVRRWDDVEPLPRTSVRAWTDDYSDVLSAVLRRVFN